ncbi:MAG: endonuclease domain-containing protein [Solirubrobacterales bacterium]
MPESRDLESVAQAICRPQHGVVARRQLLAAGIPGTTIDFRIRSFLFPVFPGVYAVGRPQGTQEGLWMAGVLAAGEGAVLGGRSAAAAWGFMKVRPGVDVVRCGRRRSARGSVDLNGRQMSVPLVIRGTRSLPARDIKRINGIPLVSAARALLDLAPTLTPTLLKYGFIEADRLELLEDDDLVDCLERGRGRPGAAAFRSHVLGRIPDLDRAKSLLEGLMLDACHREGVGPPEVNVVICGHEVDCVWRDRRVAVELDSYGFHRGLEKFEKDLARNNRLWADGWILLRYTWRRVTREPDQVVREVRAALSASQEGVT